jgi:hypothetical protein
VRDGALLLLTLDTGIRPSEVLSLRPADVDLATRTLTVGAEVAKTRRTRTLPLSPTTVAALRHLLAARPGAWGADVPLFASETGGRLFGLRERPERYGRVLGVRGRPYDLRHSFALLYLRQGGDAFSLQRLLGHTDLSMTRRYAALVEADVRDAHEAASPLVRLLPQARASRGSRAPRGRSPGHHLPCGVRELTLPLLPGEVIRLAVVSAHLGRPAGQDNLRLLCLHPPNRPPDRPPTTPWPGSVPEAPRRG